MVEQREALLDKIENLQKVLGILDYKIEVYDEVMLKLEQDFADTELVIEK